MNARAPADYRSFLEAKVRMADSFGFDIEPCEVNPKLKPHQIAIVVWAVAGGRRAIFCAFGLGKTVIQLEVVRITRARAGGMALIVIPLGVRQEFIRDAGMLGIKVKFVRGLEECDDPEGIYLTNYETVRDGKLDPRHFSVASLDEAACLRGFGGTKTFREFMAMFAGDDRRDMNNRISGEGVRYRFVATATPSPNEYVELLAYCAFLGVMDVGQAKAQPLDAKVLTPAGWRLMGDLAAGDAVIAGDGSATRVLATYPQGEKEIFRVSFSDGTSTECTADHLWLTRTIYERNNERRYRQRNQDGTREFATVKTTAEIAETLTVKGGLNHAVSLAGLAQLHRRELPIHPWVLGALLGDACLRATSVVFSTADEWMRVRMAHLLPDGLSLRETAEGSQDYGITTTGKKGGNGPGSNPLLLALRDYNLLGKRSHEKAIPKDYLFSSVDDRLELLRGLMDTDGAVSKNDGQETFCTTSSVLAEQVRDLVRSLGGIATVREASRCGLTRNKAYLVEIRIEVSPFSLPRKVELHRKRGPRALTRYIVSIECVGIKQAQCIAIEHPSRLYVTDDYVVTHNTRFFKRNSEKADQLTIHPHKEREFWLWMASWTLFVQKPSDLGYSDDGYELPPIDVHWHEVEADHSAAGHEVSGQARMFRAEAIGVVEAAREKRDSLPARIAKMMEIRAQDPTAHRLLWHDLEAERAAIEQAIPGVTTVYGSQDLDKREASVLAFKDGEIQELATKPVLLGAGSNLQRHCAWAIFLGIGFKFADFIQAIHRIQRFLQTRPVRIDLIYTSAERKVRRDLERKWQQHNEMTAKMAEIIREHGLSRAAMASVLTRSLGVERVEVRGRDYVIANNDCVDETRRMEADSVGLILTSIPFATQYEYSPNYADFGHTDSNDHFFEQMDYLTPELLRVLHPGRLAAIHVKDRIVPGGMTGLGFQTVYPFHCETIAHFRKHGFAYMGMKTIVTDVVRENNQTYRLGWSEQCKDATKMSCGMPEYLLIFRKPPTDRTNSYADNPVEKLKPFSLDDDGNMIPFDRERPMVTGTGYSRARWQVDAHGFTRSSGQRLLTPEELLALPHDVIFKLFKQHSLESVYDFEHDVRIGEALDAAGKLPSTFMLLQPQSWSPEVWTDITRMLTLNGAQSAKGKEMHLCPMQFDIADRAIAQWSMPGEEIYDPFGGLMTVPYRALKLGRRGRASELNPAYFMDGAAYCKQAEQEMSMPTLFDFAEEAAA